MRFLAASWDRWRLRRLMTSPACRAAGGTREKPPRLINYDSACPHVVDRDVEENLGNGILDPDVCRVPYSYGTNRLKCR